MAELDVLGGLADGLAYKPSCAAATTGDVTHSMIGLPVIDGYQTVAGDRILVWQNTDQTTNGIYNVGLSAWTRSIDFSNSSAVDKGTQVFVSGGLTYAGTAFSVQENNIVFGSTNITFAATGGAALSSATAFIGSIATLRLLSASTYAYAYVSGYYAPGDGGGGLYWYDAADTTTADNGGTIIVGTNNARWYLILPDNRTVSLAQFGGKGNNSFANDTAIANALAWLVGLSGGRLNIPSGTWAFTNPVSVTNAVSIEIAGANMFDTILILVTGSGSYPYVLSCGTSAQYPTQLYLHDFHIYQPHSSTCSGVLMYNCNGALCERVGFVGGNILHAFTLNLCYGVVFNSCYANSISGSGVSATLSTINRLDSRDFLMLGCGGAQYFAFDLRGGGQDFTLTSSDIEGGWGLAIMGTCEGITIEGTYIENEVSSGPHVYAAGTVNGARVSGNWFGATAGATNFAFNQMEFSFNANWDCVIAFATAQDISGIGNFSLYPSTGALAAFPYTTLTLSSPWAVHHRALGYKKNLNGDVELGGSFSGGSDGAVIGTLPAGYRPGNTRVFACADDAATTIVIISISTAGVITCVKAASGYASVDGVHFLAEL